jgi:anti-sigma-K factor RskA
MPVYALAAVAVVALLIGVLIGQVTLHSQQSTQQQVARFTLSGHQDMAAASATVVDLKNEGVAFVDFRGLPPAGANRVYEVWLVPPKGYPVPAAVFVPDSNGSRVVLVNRSLSGYSVMAVTNEPAPDGSSAPTQQPQLYGSVA